MLCNQFILKSIQLNKSIIVNKIKKVNNMCSCRIIRETDLLFLIRKWRVLESRIPYLHVWRFHPDYEFLMRPLVEGIKFDFSSEVTVSESGDPNNCFLQLINDNMVDSQEISIFTDGFRMMANDGNIDVSCTVVVPCFGRSHLFKLNRSSSSYTAELLAMIKAMDITLSEHWTSINICSDSLSALSGLESALSSLSPFARTDLGHSVMNLSLLTAKVSSRGVSIRFTWCSHQHQGQ